MSLRYPQVTHSITGNTAGATALISSGTLTLAGGNNITLSQNGNAVTISGAAIPATPTNTLSASGTSIAGNALSLALAAGANISLQTATGASSMTISVSGLNALSASGFASSTGTMILSAGAGIGLGTGASTITISTTGSQVNSIGPTGSLSSGNITISGVNLTVSSNGAGVIQLSVAAAGGAAMTLSATQNFSLQEIAGTIVTKSGTITGTAGLGSSLFLQRINVPGTLNLSEVDIAMALAFPVTSQGAGTMSQSFVLYSFGNSTSLASVLSASSAHTWGTGTVTAGASTSLTQFQGGWSVTKIHPMTFASTSVSQGDYVVGHLLNFAQASSTWTVSLFGAPVFVTNSTSITNVSTTAQTTFTAMSLTNTSNYARIQTSTSSSQTVALTAFSTSTGISAVGLSSISLSTQQIIPQYLTVPNFVYIGTASTTSGLPNIFIAGIMSTGAVPVAITVTSAAVTYQGTAAGAQPYFALVGA